MGRMTLSHSLVVPFRIEAEPHVSNHEQISIGTIVHTVKQHARAESEEQRPSKYDKSKFLFFPDASRIRSPPPRVDDHSERFSTTHRFSSLHLGSKPYATTTIQTNDVTLRQDLVFRDHDVGRALQSNLGDGRLERLPTKTPAPKDGHQN